MIKKILFVTFSLALSVQALAQKPTDMQPWNTEGQIPAPKTKAEVAILKQQISEIQANLDVARQQLQSADRQRKIAWFVILPVAAGAAILAGRHAVSGDPRGAWALFLKPAADATFAVKLSNVLAKASVLVVGVDFIYIRFLTHNQIQAAELKINFLATQLHKLQMALDSVEQSLQNESDALVVP